MVIHAMVDLKCKRLIVADYAAEDVGLGAKVGLGRAPVKRGVANSTCSAQRPSI